MKHEQNEVMKAVIALASYAPEDEKYIANFNIIMDYMTDIVSLLNSARQENKSLAEALLKLTNQGINNREGRRKLRNISHVEIDPDKIQTLSTIEELRNELPTETNN